MQKIQRKSSKIVLWNILSKRHPWLLRLSQAFGCCFWSCKWNAADDCLGLYSTSPPWKALCGLVPCIEDRGCCWMMKCCLKSFGWIWAQDAPVNLHIHPVASIKSGFYGGLGSEAVAFFFFFFFHAFLSPSFLQSLIFVSSLHRTLFQNSYFFLNYSLAFLFLRGLQCGESSEVMPMKASLDRWQGTMSAYILEKTFLTCCAVIKEFFFTLQMIFCSSSRLLLDFFFPLYAPASFTIKTSHSCPKLHV